jgi:hypothetical protein
MSEMCARPMKTGNLNDKLPCILDLIRTGAGRRKERSRQ